jgi:starch synthase
LKILFVTSEMAPYAKTGGLADVLGALPRYLEILGHEVRTFLPLYDTIKTDGLQLETVLDTFEVPLGRHTAAVRIVRDARRPLAHFVDCPALYARGSIYGSAQDEHRRFLILGLAALHACQRLRWAPDILHCNDWQTAMLPLQLRTSFAWDQFFAQTRTLLTIHNLNYQGGFSSSIVPELEIGGSNHLLHQDLLRQGRVNFLLHGILYADGISTVSPTYAQEIQTPEHGAGLDGFLRARRSTVVGILNGVDYEEWSPETDAHIPHPYRPDEMSGKQKNREILLTKMGLPARSDIPLFGIVSRLASQKGLELVPAALQPLLRAGRAMLVVLGNGEGRLEAQFTELQAAYPRQVAFYRGFSNPLAHLIEAGADMFVMPSRYEPCGLNQMYSLKYGTVPIVHRTGGLADTVSLWNPARGTGTGFLFDHHDVTGLRWAVETAAATWHDRPAWRRLMANGMAMDFSWARQARIYETLYARLRS